MKQLVDYSGFSLRRLNEPRFSHMKLLAGWIGYFALYFITENLIPYENCHPVWCRLDDLIPFNEFFMAVYIIWPSRQDLRPEFFERDNYLTRLIAFIYSFDTSTGVCPSLHVAYSLGILSAALKDKLLKPVWKILLTFFVIMICLSVCFVKQHSAVDVFAALPLGLLAEILVYGKSYWLPKFRGGKQNA